MRLLLDTHILLWWLTGSESLPSTIASAIASLETEAFVSAATVWEISIKQALGKLDFPLDKISEILRDNGFTELPIAVEHARRAGVLPRLHADPFDRMLVAQAQHEGMTIATIDAAIRSYAVATLT